MTEVIDGKQLEDITPAVMEFLTKELERGEDDAVVLPDLYVVAVRGLLRASSHVQTFDGCHPYEYDTEDTAEYFAVRSLRRRWLYHSTRRTIDTVQGGIANDDDSIRNYRFFSRPEQPLERTEAEAALAERLQGLPFLVNQSAEGLVGYRHELSVSAVEPLGQPVCIPPASEYGVPEPLSHTEVHAVSLYTDAQQTKQAVLTVDKYGNHRQLRPVPFNYLRFEITPKRNPRLALLDHLLRLVDRDPAESYEADRLVTEFNASAQAPEAMAFYIDNQYPNEGEVRGMIGSMNAGEITAMRPPNREELSTVYSLDELRREPRTGQLYLIDQEQGKALSAADVLIDAPEKMADTIRYRRW